jgi:hypothetical protein
MGFIRLVDDSRPKTPPRNPHRMPARTSHMSPFRPMEHHYDSSGHGYYRRTEREEPSRQVKYSYDRSYQYEQPSRSRAYTYDHDTRPSTGYRYAGKSLQYQQFEHVTRSKSHKPTTRTYQPTSRMPRFHCDFDYYGSGDMPDAAAYETLENWSRQRREPRVIRKERWEAPKKKRKFFGFF